MKKKFRAATRVCRVGFLFFCAYLDFTFFIRLRGRASSIHARAGWLQFWSRRFLRVLNAKVTWEGAPPPAGLLVSNHLSYVDVLVYGSICPLVLLSKSEVRDWPVIGPLTQCAGTLYIRRESKGDVVRLGEEMAKVVNEGMVVALFLEGTSSDGSTVLPFRSSLLAPAEGHGWPVTAAWLRYSMPEGSVADEICYWRDMTFFPHLLNLLSRPGFEAFVSFDKPLIGTMNRKEMAAELHARVVKLKEAHSPSAHQAAKVINR